MSRRPMLLGSIVAVGLALAGRELGAWWAVERTAAAIARADDSRDGLLTGPCQPAGPRDLQVLPGVRAEVPECWAGTNPRYDPALPTAMLFIRATRREQDPLAWSIEQLEIQERVARPESVVEQPAPGVRRVYTPFRELRDGGAWMYHSWYLADGGTLVDVTYRFPLSLAHSPRIQGQLNQVRRLVASLRIVPAR